MAGLHLVVMQMHIPVIMHENPFPTGRALAWGSDFQVYGISG